MNDLNRNTALLRPGDNAYQVTNTLFCIVISNNKIPVDKVTWAIFLIPTFLSHSLMLPNIIPPLHTLNFHDAESRHRFYFLLYGRRLCNIQLQLAMQH